MDRFKIELPILTPETINQASVSQENIYEFLKEKIDDTHERAAKDFEQKKKLEEVSWFIEKVIASFSEKGNEIILKSADRLRGGLLFYEKIASLIDDKIKNVTDGISKVEKELFEGTNQKTLNGLLERLETVTKKKGIGEIVAKLGQSPTVSLGNHIIDIESRIQQQKNITILCCNMSTTLCSNSFKNSRIY